MSDIMRNNLTITKMDRNSQQDAIEGILNNVDEEMKENKNVMERTVYMMTLYKMLAILKGDIGVIVEQYYKLSPSQNKLALDFTSGNLGASLFVLCNAVFDVLKSSPEYYGSEYRTINGVRLEEINGIDTSRIGIPTTVPADLDSKVPSVSVGLEDLDALRISELNNISAMTGGDPGKTRTVRSLIGEMGGLTLDPLFPKQEQ